MEENKLMEGIDGETVMEVYDGTNNSNVNTMLKLGVGALVVSAVGYGVYRLCKKLKNRKNKETEFVTIHDIDLDESNNEE